MYLFQVWSAFMLNLDVILPFLLMILLVVTQ